MAYTPLRTRGEAARSPRRRSHKVSATDRGVLRVRERQTFVGTLAPVGPDAAERHYAIFDQLDPRFRRFDGYREALRAIPTGGSAS